MGHYCDKCSNAVKSAVLGKQNDPISRGQIVLHIRKVLAAVLTLKSFGRAVQIDDNKASRLK